MLFHPIHKCSLSLLVHISELKSWYFFLVCFLSKLKNKKDNQVETWSVFTSKWSNVFCNYWCVFDLWDLMYSIPVRDWCGPCVDEPFSRGHPVHRRSACMLHIFTLLPLEACVESIWQCWGHTRHNSSFCCRWLQMVVLFLFLNPAPPPAEAEDLRTCCHLRVWGLICT